MLGGVGDGAESYASSEQLQPGSGMGNDRVREVTGGRIVWVAGCR